MCYRCGEAVPLERRIGFNETCPTCGLDLHVCLMCSFHAPEARWECRESVESPVLDKEKRNYCDWFAVEPRFGRKSQGDAKAMKKAEAAKSAFDSLFGGA